MKLETSRMPSSHHLDPKHIFNTGYKKEESKALGKGRLLSGSTSLEASVACEWMYLSKKNTWVFFYPIHHYWSTHTSCQTSEGPDRHSITMVPWKWLLSPPECPKTVGKLYDPINGNMSGNPQWLILVWLQKKKDFFSNLDEGCSSTQSTHNFPKVEFTRSSFKK